MFDGLIGFMKNNGDWFGGLHYAIRAIVLAFFGAAFGALIVTFSAGGATSHYALGLGIKPPAQEIDALQSALFVWGLKYSLIIWLGLSVVIALFIKFETRETLRSVLFFVGLAGFIGFYVYVFALLFSPNQFESLLMKTKLGGFSDIVLYENLNDKTELKHECQLVLYAADTITCYFEQSKTYTQFPIGNLQRVDFVVK